LYRGPLPPDKRLADLTLNDYKGRVLVVVDGRWAKEFPEPGFWIYRDATKDNAGEGDLRVFDEYSKETDYEKMRDEQIEHFEEYTGLCTKTDDECDLFVLSWTLTPDAGSKDVGSLSRTPNQHLADEVAKMPVENAYGKIINVAFVDYVQNARPSDVAIAQKDTGGPVG
jgi:hypothetical protein